VPPAYVNHIPNFVALGQTIWAYVESPQNLWDAEGSAPSDVGVANPQNTLVPHLLPYEISLQ